MDAFTYNLLAVFAGFAYAGSVLFLWAIHRETAASGLRNAAVSANAASLSVGANRPGFIRAQWKSLLTLALVFGGGFGFFITHVCPYK